ncbi:MAG TPA: lysylphosphatidylglycerol synthase transmembrane domain-containing protein [Bryobacteraceae bacterium]|nr:lysylphosphatidylglycerol synthase transmembrane domain-containing protein [Bryobacteraceae bacterium]
MGEHFGQSARARVIFVLINVIALGFLAWSLRHFNVGALIEDFETTNWWWISFAILSDVAVYALQAWRWQVLLRPVEPVPYRQALRAVYIGLFGNEVLGFAAGEVVRCYVIARFTALPFSVSLSSALIERIFDGMWLCASLILTLRVIGLPHRLHWIVDGSYVLGGVVLIVAVLLGFAMFHHHRARSALQGGSWKKHLRVLIDDLSLIGHSRYLYFSLLISLPYLLMQTVPVWATFRGFGFYDLSLFEAFGFMVILRMAMAVPQAPGNIGYLLLSKELMLVLFGAVARDAENFSLLIWGLVTLRVVLGAIALATTGSKFGELHRAAHTERAELSKARDSVTSDSI